MSNTVIELKHSRVIGNTPSSLANGEISINTADGKIFYKDPNGSILAFERYTGPSGLDGEIQFNDSGELGSNSALSFDKSTGILSAKLLSITNSVGAEGGEILLAKPASETTLNGTGITVDSYQNKIRFFEQGGTSRGAYIDLTECSAGAGTNLLNPTTVSDEVARTTSNAAFDKANSAYDLANTAYNLANTSGGAATYTKKTSNYTANSGDVLIADTTSGQFTITLPSTPDVGASVVIADGGNWSNTSLIVGRNGSTIEGLNQDLVVDIGSIKLEFVYDGSTWELITPVGTIATSDDTSTDTTYYPALVGSVNGNTIKTSSTKLYFNPSSGTLSATSLNSLSDRNLKENILPLNKKVLSDINPVEFTWKDSGCKSYGLIAQELEKILPELVETDTNSGIKSISYIQLIPFLISEIKDLQDQINTLKGNSL